MLDGEDGTLVGRAHGRMIWNLPLVPAATRTTRNARATNPWKVGQKNPGYTGFAGLLGAVLDHTKPRSGTAVGSHPRRSSSRIVLRTIPWMVSAWIACFNATLISVWYQPDQPTLRLPSHESCFRLLPELEITDPGPAIARTVSDRLDGRLRQPVPILAKAAPRNAWCQGVRAWTLVDDGSTERASILKNCAQASRQMG